MPPSRAIAGAVAASLLALALFVALPPKGAELPELFEFVGRFHTLAVHLPVGVLLLVACAELLTRWPRLRERIDPALDLALPFLVASAAAAFSLGVLLARGGGYPTHLVTMHRTFTLLAVIGCGGCLVAWTTRLRPDGVERRGVYRVTLAATLAVLTVGAHFGGSLTHGDTYLTRYAPAFVQKLLGVAPPAPAVEAAAPDPGAEPLVYANVVAPLLQRECVGCHGADKTKGGLRLDSLAAILKGGDTGPAVSPGHGAASLLVQRMALPSGNDDHMPPAEKPQPTSGEVQLLQWWIDRGASDTLRVRDTLAPDGARTILGSSLGGGSLAAPDGAPAVSGAPGGSPPPSGIGAGAPPSTEPATGASASPAQAAPGAGALAYRDVIAPMLSRACGDCHGAAKQKGKLRVDSMAALLAGGKSGPAIVPGDASRSALLTRVHLSLDDDKHMPPQEEPQLSAAQIAALSAWVAHGASETMAASELPRGAAGPLRTASAHPKPAAPPAQEATSSQQASSTPPAPPAAVAATPASLEVGPGQVALYRDVVAPLLVRRCGECHAGTHDEGGMKVDDLAQLVKDRDLVPGKPADSPLVKRMQLPASDGNRMPPPERDPANAWEADAVAAWVARGASPDLVVASSDLPPSVARALAAVASTPTAPGAAPPAAAASASASPPPGSVVPLRASGCGACAVGEGGAGGARSIAVLAAIVGALALRLRRRSAPVAAREV